MIYSALLACIGRWPLTCDANLPSASNQSTAPNVKLYVMGGQVRQLLLIVVVVVPRHVRHVLQTGSACMSTCTCVHCTGLLWGRKYELGRYTACDG
jgi:hypothetical protein